MTTKVRTYKADSMQGALDRVKDELGDEAVILHTRQFEERRLLPWMKPRVQVEVTAGVGVNVRTATPRSSKPRTNGVHPPQTSPQPESLATQLLAQQGPHNGVELQLSNATGAPPATPLRQPAEPALPPPTRPIDQLRHAPENHTREFTDKLNSIQQMLQNLEQTRHIGGKQEIPSELFHLYTELIDADVEDHLARELISRLKQDATPSQLEDAQASRALLTAMVESEIRVSEPIIPTPGRRKVVALIGPTGVGKTTTIAKLAANFRLRDGIKMGLVTVDTYRIAAVEQLRTYAEIIDLPMKVVTSPIEMRRALDELSGLDLVLIDTAGRSPRDELKIQELRSLLAEADVDEVHLVLSATASVRGIQATVEKFAGANTTSLILTKLDEAAEMGTLFSLARRVNVPVSYLTTGQNVPDDIEPANASRMARLVLGQDRLMT